MINKLKEWKKSAENCRVTNTRLYKTGVKTHFCMPLKVLSCIDSDRVERSLLTILVWISYCNRVAKKLFVCLFVFMFVGLNNNN